MTRGRSAPLSANEEVTLRRIALGICKTSQLSQRDVERLRTICLIEDTGGSLKLTPLGRERYLALPKSVAVDESGTPDELFSKLTAFMDKARS